MCFSYRKYKEKITEKIKEAAYEHKIAIVLELIPIGKENKKYIVEKFEDKKDIFLNKTILNQEYRFKELISLNQSEICFNGIEILRYGFYLANLTLSGYIVFSYEGVEVRINSSIKISDNNEKTIFESMKELREKLISSALDTQLYKIIIKGFGEDSYVFYHKEIKDLEKKFSSKNNVIIDKIEKTNVKELAKYYNIDLIKMSCYSKYR